MQIVIYLTSRVSLSIKAYNVYSDNMDSNNQIIKMYGQPDIPW